MTGNAMTHEDIAPSPEIAARYDVVIVGAGLAGCAVAQAMARADQGRRRSILLVDLHREVSPRFSGEYIHPRGAEVLDELGFYNQLLAAGAVDVDGFVVMEHAESDDPVVLDYRSIPGERPRGISVHHKTLVKVMRRIVGEQPQVSLRTPWRVVELIRAGERFVGVVLQDARGGRREVRCDLIVAADGKASTVRKLAGMADNRRNLGFTAGIELRDAAVAHQRHATVFLGGPGPMLCYPIVGETDPDGRERLSFRLTFDLPRALPAKGTELSAYLLDAFVPYLPTALAEQVGALLENRERPVEMAPTFDLPAPPATAPGLALVG
ncbi:MAG: FAD-dependent monooxygenase, partial [Myxococcales bacterium]|nr:FAD-dependent monooxygenase [Myxococcales bacterium]